MTRSCPSPHARVHRARAGFTIFEVIVVLAIAGVLMGIGTAALRPPAARLAASSSASVVQQAKFEAIRSNRPVVVRVDGTTITLHRAPTATSVDCGAALPSLRSLDLSEYRNVTVQSATGFPFVWLASGEARTCPSGAAPLGVDGLSLRVGDGSTTRTVVVAPGGSVDVR